MKSNDRTRNQWLQEYRKVKKGEKPSGFLNVTIPRHTDHEEFATDGSVTKWTTVETTTRRIPVFREAQTVPYKRMCPSVLRAMYQNVFVGSRKKYIWKTGGHWVTCKTSYLDNDKIKAHILGKEIYGVRAGDFTEYIVVDADLHRGNKDVFCKQLDLIMEHFHGRYRTHYSASEGGVHVIIMFDKPMPIDKATDWLRKELESIDTPELAQLAVEHNMKTISEMEIKPSRTTGWRLPFAAGRVTCTDRPLVGNEWKTFEKYMLWLRKPSYASRADAFAFISGHLKQQEQQVPAKKKVGTCKKKQKQGVVLVGSLGKQKGCYRNTLVDFWTGKTTPADSLNTGIVLTARMMPKYFADSDDAVDYIEELIDDLPDEGFSDRLSSGNRKEVSRIIRATVGKVYAGNGGQPRVEQSNEKLAATKRAWDRIGFKLTDKTTWGKASSALGHYFNFTTPSQIKSLGYLADILKTSLETCTELTRQVLRIVHTQRELSVKYFLKVAKSFGIGTRHDGRINEYVNALCSLGWIIRLKDYMKGRARTFIAGDEFYGQVSSSPSSTPTHAYESMVSVPLFALERELEELVASLSVPEASREPEKPPPEPDPEPVLEFAEK